MKYRIQIRTILFLSLITMILSASAAFADEKTGADTRAAVRVSGGQAILYDPVTNADWTGMRKVNQVPAGSGNLYYFKSTNGAVYNSGFFTVGKKTFYAQADGRLLTGVQPVGSTMRYFTARGVMKKNGIIKLTPDMRYYADKKGRLRKGLRNVNGKTYYFDPVSRLMQFGWIKVGKNTYFMRTGGKRKGQAATGWLKKNGAKYYFDEKGRMVHGWRTINGKKNYFDPDTGEAYTGVRKIGGKTYNFGSGGIAATGPWSIKVNQSTNTVTVYRGDTAVNAFACSVGLNGATPSGNFRLLDKLRWHELMGPSWGQWCSHITSDILFHSIPYNSPYNNHSMSTYAYNQLGRAASHGCIRLAAKDAKYLYDNCPVGTRVVIFHGRKSDDPMGKPMPAHVGSWKGSYDPTDPTA